MKLNRIIKMCAVAAAMVLTVGSAFAQDNGNGNGNANGNANGNNGQDNGGIRRNRQGGGGFQNMTPEERNQRRMDSIRDSLNFTNDTDWSAVQPLVQKVVDAQRDVFMAQMRNMFGGRNRDRGQGGGGSGQQGRGNPFGGQSSPEQDALQNALDQDAPAAQVKDLLAKYKAAQQAKQAKLEAAQDALKSVLSTKQEAQAYLMGLVR